MYKGCIRIAIMSTGLLQQLIQCEFLSVHNIAGIAPFTPCLIFVETAGFLKKFQLISAEEHKRC